MQYRGRGTAPRPNAPDPRKKSFSDREKSGETVHNRQRERTRTPRGSDPQRTRPPHRQRATAGKAGAGKQPSGEADTHPNRPTHTGAGKRTTTAEKTGQAPASRGERETPWTITTLKNRCAMPSVTHERWDWSCLELHEPTHSNGYIPARARLTGMKYSLPFHVRTSARPKLSLRLDRYAVTD